MSELSNDELCTAFVLWAVMLYSAIGSNLFILCTDLDGLWLKMAISSLYCLGLV